MLGVAGYPWMPVIHIRQQMLFFVKSHYWFMAL